MIIRARAFKSDVSVCTVSPFYGTWTYVTVVQLDALRPLTHWRPR